ncbi:MAG: hypothetical protein IJX27_06250, partial [Clostridia bacterium]|nr:hypothetical protein [Clostridia bacterium]
AMQTGRIQPRGVCSFAFAAAQSEEEALFLLCEKSARRTRRFSEICRLQYGASGLARKYSYMKNALLRAFCFPAAAQGGEHAGYARDLFWRHGISGENHTAVAFFAEDEESVRGLALIIRLFKYMSICGERFDLIVFYDESDQYRGAQKNKIELITEAEGCRSFMGRECGIHAVSRTALAEGEAAALTELCEFKAELSSPLLFLNCEGFFEISQEAERGLLPGVRVRGEGGFSAPHGALSEVERGAFTPFGFAVNKACGCAPFATVASNGLLSFVATENSLGFTFWENAALGKLTPHTADNMREDSGERLILRVYGEEEKFQDYDLCAYAHTARLGDCRAIYSGEAAGSAYTVCAALDSKMPVKKISVKFERLKECRAELFFVCSPCLGERREKEGRYIYSQAGEALYIRSVFENPLALALWASGAKAVTNEAELLSGGRACGGAQTGALCKELSKEECEPEFYLAALTAGFTREDFEAFLLEERFEECPSAPIFESVNIKTQSALFDLSVNRLFPYQTYYSRFVGRTGFYQVGGAYGFRDQLQDSLSFLENAPGLCREQIVRAAAHQYREGDAAHWWHTYAGKETGLRSRYSDDLLWLPFALCEYVEKTGDESILYEEVPYLCSPPLDAREHERYEAPETEGSGSVLEHALLAAHLVWRRGFGAHSLLKIGGGDWNDGMNLVGAHGEGESTWLTEFCAIIYSRLARLCRRLGDGENASFFEKGAAKLYEGFCAAFYGGWYLRGYYDSGAPLGKKGSAECEVDSLAQSFAVFAELELFGKVTERTKGALCAAAEKLYDNETGIMKLLAPPFDKGQEKPGYIKGYLPGIRENGGQYTHAAVWTAMALLLSGEKERGFEVLMRINPAVRSGEHGFCARYKIEPYALAGDVYSHPEHAGRGGWSHYTGAAAWYRKAVLEVLFGLRLRGEGFLLSPHMPRALDGAELSLFIRGTRYRVRYFFCGRCGAVLDGKIIESDGKKIKKCFFPLDGGEHTLDFCMEDEE